MSNVVPFPRRDAEQEMALACSCDSEDFNVVVDRQGLHLYCTGCEADLGRALDALDLEAFKVTLGYFEPSTVQ